MSQRPQLWMLVGGNGSGKTTFYAKFLKPFGIHFINADLIAKELAPDKPETVSYEAAQIAEQIRLDFLQEKISFCFETVFSHPSKLEFVKKARALGYEVIMVFIHLDNAQLNIARITQRVAEGGHFVPNEKVSSRIQRLKQNVKTAIFHVDRFVAIDNSYRDRAFIKQLEFKQGMLSYRCEELELWAEEFMINESDVQVRKS